MANNVSHLYSHLLLFILLLIIASHHAIQGAASSRTSLIVPSRRESHSRGGSKIWVNKNPRRLMIGSVAPTCTYNECRGCKYKCRAEQVPVEGNDPLNSPYHYKCICHR